MEPTSPHAPRPGHLRTSPSAVGIVDAIFLTKSSHWSPNWQAPAQRAAHFLSPHGWRVEKLCGGLRFRGKLFGWSPTHQTPEHISNRNPLHSPVGLLERRHPARSDSWQDFIGDLTACELYGDFSKQSCTDPTFKQWSQSVPLSFLKVLPLNSN